MKKILVLLSIMMFFLLPQFLSAAEVKIGVPYPMSGPSAQAGLDAKHAVELALDIINTTKYKHLNLPLQKLRAFQTWVGLK